MQPVYIQTKKQKKFASEIRGHLFFVDLPTTSRFDNHAAVDTLQHLQVTHCGKWHQLWVLSVVFSGKVAASQSFPFPTSFARGLSLSRFVCRGTMYILAMKLNLIL